MLSGLWLFLGGRHVRRVAGAARRRRRFAAKGAHAQSLEGCLLWAVQHYAKRASEGERTVVMHGDRDIYVDYQN